MPKPHSRNKSSNVPKTGPPKKVVLASDRLAEARPLPTKETASSTVSKRRRKRTIMSDDESPSHEEPQTKRARPVPDPENQIDNNTADVSLSMTVFFRRCSYDMRLDDR